jgi:purine catabolism regulator
MLTPAPKVPLEAYHSLGTHQEDKLVPPSLSPAAWLEQDVVGSLVQLVRSLPDFERMVANLVQTVTALFDAEKAGVMLWDPESQELVLQKPAFGVSNSEIIDQYRVRLSDGGNAIRVFTTGQSYLSNDCPGDAHILQKYVDLFGSRNVMTVPLMVDGQVIGVLHVTNKRQGDFTEHELHLLEKVADHLATLINNARLFRAVRRSEHEADTLYHLSLKLASLQDPKEILASALPTAVTLLDAEVAGAHLNSSIHHVYDREAGRDIPEYILPVSFWRGKLVGQQATSFSLDEGHVHVSQDSWQRTLSAHGLREIQLVPLVGDEVMGVFFVARRHRQPFTRADEKLQARLALVISSAIRNAELQRKTERALEELRSSLESIARLRDMQEKLTELVLRGERLSSLTAAIAGIVNNPALLEDRHGAVLSSASPPGWFGPEPVTLAQVAQRDRKSARLIGELYRLGHHARLLQIPGEDSLRLVAPVIVGNETLAVLSVPQILNTLGDLEVLAVQGGATVVALVLMRERAILETERRLQGDLLGDILTGRFESEEDLARRARYLGYDLLHPHVLLVVSIDDFEHLIKLGEREEALQRIKQNIYDLVRASLAPRTPRWLIWASGTMTVAMVTINPDDPNPIFEVARRLHSRAERELRGTSVFVGVSQVCRTMREVPTAYAEVKRFLKFGRAMQWQSGLIFVDRLGLYRILLQQEELGSELIRFASDRLGCLQAYDLEHNGDLIACLHAYIANGGEIKATAQSLRLHRNSVRYKLQRIEEIAQVDLNNSETRFQLQLALKIIDLQSAIKMSAVN